MSDHEATYLGMALANNEILIGHPLRPEHFSRPDRISLFAAMAEITAAGKSADIVTVAAHARANGWAPENLVTWLSGLIDMGFTSAGAGSVADEIRKAHKLRTFKRWLVNATALAELDPDRAVEMAEGELMKLLGDEEQKPFVTFGEAAKTWLEDMLDENGQAVRVKTGDADLDKNWILDCGGLHILAGRPSMGKTSVAVWVMQRLASQGCPVLFFSLEMTSAQLVQKQVAEWTRISSWEIMQNFPAHAGRVIQAVGEHRDIGIMISDHAAQTVERIAMVSQFAKRHRGVGAVVVDYIQLVRSASRFGSREQEVSHVSQSLKALAKRLEIPVIALSQLNRAVEGRTNRRPLLSDLRESGAIEQDADTVAMLFRPEYYLAQENKPITDDERGLIELNVAKQRRIGPQLVCGRWRPDVNAFMWGAVEQRKLYSDHTEPRRDE